jgi:hypothetical protein
MMTTYSYVNDYGKVKVDATNPNKITPKLQKGLILDMPLSEPYTEASNTITKDRTPYGNDGTVNGATIKYDGLVNTSAGIAYIPLTRQNTYQFRAKHQNTGATYMFASQNITGTEGYGLRLHTDGKLQLFEDTGQIAETAASYLVDNTDYQFKATWSQAGVFTVYIKGGSYGWDSWTTAITHTDTTYDDAFYFVANTTADCEVSDLQVL